MDLFLVILIYIVVILILCGFFSLGESNLLALLQLRIGPALFFFGLFSPIFDGLNLFLNFSVLLVNVDYLYFILFLLLSNYVLYMLWFVFPVGYIVFIDYSFSVFLVLGLHAVNSISSVYIVGCVIFCSSYAYLASVSCLFFTLVSEACLLIFCLLIFVLNYSGFFSLKLICVDQVYVNNIFFLNVWSFFVFTFIIYLDNSKLPFDYLECESELVAGVVVEFSGIFFVIYSLMEIIHVMISSFLIMILFFGGFYICMNSLIIVVFVFMLPRAILCSISITNAYSFFVLYIYFFLFAYLIWYVMTNFFLFFIL